MIQEVLIEIAKGAVVGGLIGYATNRLAVAMLFRPHQPWMLFGRQIPMTPGLVVKNRDRLAEAVGRSVGEDLLDQDTLLHHLREARLHEVVEGMIRSRAKEMENSEETLAELLGKEFSTSLHEALVPLVDKELEKFISSPGGKSFLAGLIKPVLDQNAADLVGKGGIEALSNKVTQFLEKTLAGPESLETMRPLIKGALIEGLSGDSTAFLVDPLKEPIKEAIPDAAERIQDGIADYLASEEFGVVARSKLSVRITALVLDKFPMASMFINKGMINEMLANRWESIADDLIEMAHSEELRSNLESRLLGLVDWVEEGIGRVLTEDATREKLATWASGKLIERLPLLAGSQAINDGITRALGETLDQPVGDLLGSQPGEVSRQIACKLSDALTGEQGATMRRHGAEAIVSQGVLGIRPAGFMRPEFIAPLTHRVSRWVEGRVLEAAPELLRDRLKIREIVTEKIARFETEALEETIHRVSGRELKGIVRLGGVIGVFVGATAQLLYYLLL
ncbi:MAG: DUF445 family protein [Candidatus Sumerlaeia bacterium]|nr:DUF445 family protein [Candidatus Sumerlaeia bacterium]